MKRLWNRFKLWRLTGEWHEEEVYHIGDDIFLTFDD